MPENGWFTIYLPADDDDGLLHIKITDEGLIIDLWDKEGVNLINTWCSTAEEITESLLMEGDINV